MRSRIIDHLALLGFLSAFVVGCSGATTIARKIALPVSNAATAFYEELPAWDLAHQREIVATGKAAGKTQADIDADLAAYRKVRDEKALASARVLRRALHALADGLDVIDGGGKADLGALVSLAYNALMAVQEAVKLMGFNLPLLDAAFAGAVEWKSQP
jgi:hypothetical protein